MSQVQSWKEREIMRAIGRRPTERIQSYQSRAMVMPQPIVIDTVWLFLIAATLTMVLTISVVVLKTKYAPVPSIYGRHNIESGFSNAGPTNKQAVLEQLTRNQTRLETAQINYVSEIIGNLNTRTNVNPAELAKLIVLESNRGNVDPLYVAAVIKSESTFDRHAVSNVGALGLMQIMPATGRYISKIGDIGWQGYSNLKDPTYNIRLGIAYLKHMEDMFNGNREHALIAYNWGPSNLSTALRAGKSAPASTRKYARKIIADHSRWNMEYLDRRAKDGLFNPKSSVG